MNKKTAKKLTKKEISNIKDHTWAIMNRCLERTSPENRDQVKELLTEINELGIKKADLDPNYYNTISKIFKLFFSTLVWTAHSAGMASIAERLKKQNSALGVKKREAFGGLSKIRNIPHLSKEIENAADHLYNLLEEHFKKTEYLLGARKAEILNTKNLAARGHEWLNKTRIVEAAKLLQAIDHSEPYKALSELLKLVPPYRNISRQGVYAIVNRNP